MVVATRECAAYPEVLVGIIRAIHLAAVGPVDGSVMEITTKPFVVLLCG